MFWGLYIFLAFCLSYCFASLIKTRFLTVFFICLILFLTPAQIEVGSTNYAPAFFTFLFNSILERDYSLRPLRPLMLSIPVGAFILWIFFITKKRFF
tara:strand:+ start:133 stop:423 length:291 start_codon:yes stop_codon:yes gene_type:complete